MHLCKKIEHLQIDPDETLHNLASHRAGPEIFAMLSTVIVDGT